MSRSDQSAGRGNVQPPGRPSDPDSVTSVRSVPARGLGWVRAGFGLGVLLLVAQFAEVVPAIQTWVDGQTWFDNVVQDGLYGLAALLVLARALLVRRDRGAWLLMAAGLGA